eukprot:scaffold76484_cov36-Phaeocystis_antarctica.AAC.1
MTTTVAATATAAVAATATAAAVAATATAAAVATAAATTTATARVQSPESGRGLATRCPRRGRQGRSICTSDRCWHGSPRSKREMCCRTRLRWRPTPMRLPWRTRPQ